MDKLLEQSLLFDFYGELLNEHQKTVYEMYIFENLSLAEIAETAGISRQGVFETLKRASGILEKYEAKLHMVETYRKLDAGLKKIKKHLDLYRQSHDEVLIENIEMEIDSILNEI